MNNTKKIAIGVVAVAVIGIAIYFLSHPQSESIANEPEISNTETASTTTDTSTSNTPNLTLGNTAPTKTVAPQPTVKPTTGANLTYKGQFFPFTFIYPSSFNNVKNPQQSTSELETKSFNFLDITDKGAIGGFVTFYVSEGNSDNYEDLVATSGNTYSKVQINGMTFYKYVAKEPGSSNSYKIEYTTFKKDAKYRFSLVVGSSDKKDLSIDAYKSEIDMFENIVKSLKIS